MKTFNKIKLSLLYSSVLLIISCTSNKNDPDKLLNILSQNIQRSSSLLVSDTKDKFQQLIAHRQDVTIAYHVTDWIKRAQLFMDASKGAVDSIEQLKHIHKNSEAQLKINLDQIINALKDIYFRIDTTHKEYLKNKMQEILVTDSGKSYGESIQSEFYRGETFDLLCTKVENDVRCLENFYVSYCNVSSLPSCNLGVIISSILIGQNTNHLKEGQTLEISAGVGLYTTEANLSARINDQILDADKNGLIDYKLETKTIGKHNLPINLKYLDFDGKSETKTIPIEYEVDK